MTEENFYTSIFQRAQYKQLNNENTIYKHAP